MRINTTGQMLRSFGALALVAAAAVSCDRGPAPEPSTAAPDVTTAAAGLTSAERENPVRRPYQYVALYNTIVGWALDEKSPFYTGGFNNTFKAKGLMDATARDIPRPNNDTLYIMSTLDLRAEPVIIHYPAFNSRYVSVETSALDHYVNIPLSTSKGDFKKPTNFLYYSARTEGYSGEPVEGVDKIMELSGDFAVAFLRVMPEATDPAKFKANMAAIKNVKLQTLSEFQGKPAKPVVKAVFPAYGNTFNTFGNEFLPVMQFVFNHTSFDPNNEMDVAALAALKTIGVEPGKQYDADRVSTIDGKQLEAAAEQTSKQELEIWTDPKQSGPFLTKLFQPKGNMNIDTMVLQSCVGPIGQPADQAMYPGVGTSDGQPINAQYDYVIRMSADELPPAIAFWSATLYDAKQGFFIPNQENKYSVGQNAGMKLDASGGIEIHIAAEQPEGVPAENWLPITRGDLDLDVIMRVYQPDLQKMETWTAPMAEKVSA